jgi:DNA-binding MarR family transcriptional regulator
MAARELGCWVSGVGVSETEFRLLWLLFHGIKASDVQTNEPPAFDQADLSNRLAISAAQVSSVVESLRQRLLIDRDAAGADRRRQRWRLAPTGRDLVLAVIAAVAKATPAAAPTHADRDGKEAA